MRRRLINFILVTLPVLLLGAAAFLLVALPRINPQNRAAMIQLSWPLEHGHSRTFDLCTFNGTVYVGTKVDEPELVGDPFNVKPRLHPPPPRRPEFVVGCDDDYHWRAGAEYEVRVQDARRGWRDFEGWHWRGSGVAYRPSGPQPWEYFEFVVALATPHAVLLLVAAAALPAAILARRWRRRRTIEAGRCRTCGYDLRATPDRCPQCGATPTAPAEQTKTLHIGGA